MSVHSETRPRRHTITRPDSAMALLSDIENEDEDDDREQQETFDRISGILSNLIQEANEAVQDIENERVHLLKKSKRASKTPKVYTSSTILTRHNPDTKRTRKTRASHTPCVHVRNPSSSSTTSNSSTLFSPLSASSASSSSTATTLSSSPPSVNKKLFRHTAFRPRQSPSVTGSQRRSTTPRTRKRSQTVQDTIMESFKRLDSSMALVDSLSRDLATTTEEDDKKSGPLDNTRMTLLLLIPLLHIPHSLITMIFDFCTSPTVSNRTSTSSILSSPSFSISSMVFWACVFTVTNLMVDQVAIIPKRFRYHALWEVVQFVVPKPKWYQGYETKFENFKIDYRVRFLYKSKLYDILHIELDRTPIATKIKDDHTRILESKAIIKNIINHFPFILPT
ncbi:hypothetical protein CU097_011103 [Rhizopus azygosporus]|uniref:Uncharacterized protein n=1 Tax=Rhizopus azygosporus TaxID=86630 RepID=A0A367K520_RHIAZ|nr:hypothetical protein CU097_011103 [Rhizopus azygosporus]